MFISITCFTVVVLESTFSTSCSRLHFYSVLDVPNADFFSQNQSCKIPFFLQLETPGCIHMQLSFLCAKVRHEKTREKHFPVHMDVVLSVVVLLHLLPPLTLPVADAKSAYI
ncbi:hypothetical protein AMECASPLE_031902 [Ameca splendens]|uniref:Secreted protein n=1 Tax=Ameca splendens TaxID=208324 RepID=A0ABV1ACU9_9TELE